MQRAATFDDIVHSARAKGQNGLLLVNIVQAGPDQAAERHRHRVTAFA